LTLFSSGASPQTVIGTLSVDHADGTFTDQQNPYYTVDVEKTFISRST